MDGFGRVEQCAAAKHLADIQKLRAVIGDGTNDIADANLNHDMVQIQNGGAEGRQQGTHLRLNGLGWIGQRFA